MIEVWIGSRKVVLEPGTGVGFHRRSPLFQAEVIRGSRSYNIVAPAVPENDYIFKHARFVELKNKMKAFDCTATFSGSIITKGKFVLIDAETTYNGVLTVSEFSVDILDKNLRDFSYGPDVVMGVSSADVAAFCQNDYKADGYSFPEVFNTEFYNEQNDAWLGILNFKHSDPTLLVNTVVDDSLESDNKFAFAPSFYVHWILQKVADELGYIFDGNFFEKQDLDDLLLVGNTPFDELGSSYSASADSQPGYVTGIVEHFFSTANNLITRPNENSLGNHHAYYATATGLHRFTMRGTCSINTTYNFRKLVVLHQLGTLNYTTLDTFELTLQNQSITNFEFEIEVYLQAGDVVQPWIAFQGSGVGVNYNVIAGNLNFIEWKVVNLSNELLNVYKKSWAIADHVPNITVPDLIKELKKVFNLSVYPHPQEKRVTFTITEDAISSAKVVDWTDKIRRKNNKRNQPKLTFSKDEGRLFKWQDESVSGDVRKVGDARNDYLVKLSPMKTTYLRDVDPFEVRRTMFVGKFKAETPMYDIGESEFSWNMCFADNAGLQRSFQLKWNFNNGVNDDLFTMFWENSIEIELFGERVDYDLALNMNDLQTIDFLRKVHLDGIMCLLLDQKNDYAEKISLSSCKLVKV